MDPYADTLRLVASWRTYRRMMADDARYVRLVADLALVIRSRLK
mgnify:FL=1